MDGNERANSKLTNEIDRRVDERFSVLVDRLESLLNKQFYSRIDTLNEQEADILHQISSFTDRIKNHQEFMDAFLVRFSIGFLLVMMFGGAIGAGFTVLLLRWGGYL